MYHTPHIGRLWKQVVPARWNETIGLQHCKVYIFNDSVIISGANFSNDCFTNRQDRYVLVENCPMLADFYKKLIGNIADFSLKMDKKSAVLFRRNFLHASLPQAFQRLYNPGGRKS